MEEITVTELRSKLYKVVDDVLRTGKSQIVVRGGEKLKLSPVGRGRGKNKVLTVEQGMWDKLRKMGKRKHSAVQCSDEELIYGKLAEWNEPGNL